MSMLVNFKTMPALHLDFIGQKSAFKLTFIGCVLLIAGLVAAYFTWQFQQEILAQQADTTFALQQIEQQKNQSAQLKAVKTSTLKSNVTPIKPEQIKELQLTTHALNMPWNNLLDGLEKSSNPDIALLVLQPDTKKQLLTLSGEAKNLPAALAYIDSLEKLPMLEKVILQKHNVSETDIDKPVRFTLLANWQLDAMFGVEK